MVAFTLKAATLINPKTGGVRFYNRRTPPVFGFGFTDLIFVKMEVIGGFAVEKSEAISIIFNKGSSASPRLIVD